MSKSKSAKLIRETVNLKLTEAEQTVINGFIEENGLRKGVFYKKLALDHVRKSGTAS